MTQATDSLTLDVLQANVHLLAEKERLEHERQRLLELDQTRTEVLARISHDLRTPLSSIIGFSDLILTGEGGKLNKVHQDFIQAINRNGHQLLALINDLLDLSTLDARRMTIRRERVALADLQSDVRAATEPLLRLAGLQATWQTPGQLNGRTACVDRRRMLQVLTNLVDNARKFTPSGGKVVLHLDADDQEYRFSISDTGPGIPEADRTKIFRPYSQRAAAAARGEGVGLGLAIVKAIVDLHGATVTLAESQPGSGCSFNIRGPQRTEEPVAEATP
jgi:signal transduction histidine kinase